MSENISLEELVLGYCRQAGGIVEPPAYGVYEILLPDEVAARWKIGAHQRFAFSTDAENVTHLHYGHALVEIIVEELRQKIANGRFFINNVRPEKPKLYEVIEKAISLPNAKMFPLPNAAQQVQLHHYVRLNFKVSLIADEKRELILPLWMDLQSGYAVNGEDIERAAILDAENNFPNLEPASLYWLGEKPLSQKAFSALLERARLSVARELGDTLSTLQKRLQRFLELDCARLNEYYDDLRKDAERRLQKAEDDRRLTLEAKLAAIASERLSKLADVEQKYHLHIQLQLLNLAVIAQPKVDLDVEIRKRTASVKRRLTWDPLLHVVESLVCDVCGNPGNSIFLCENGHLAHAECLAPQCVECKRSFCQKCANEVQTCAVCERPVCVHSLNRCRICGRTTCHEHVEMCHAVDGAPLRLVPGSALSAGQETAPVAGTSSQVKTPATEAGKTTRKKSPTKRETPKTRLSAAKKSPDVAGEYLEVYSDPAQNQILAHVILRKREIATRIWSMTDEGFAVNCWCEKSDCSERGIVYRPWDAERITGQVLGFVKEFASEYGVPDKKIRFFQIRQREAHSEARLKVPVGWKDPQVLEKARIGFETLRYRNKSGS
jgi:hypothetical protein